MYSCILRESSRSNVIARLKMGDAERPVICIFWEIVHLLKNKETVGVRFLEN